MPSFFAVSTPGCVVTGRALRFGKKCNCACGHRPEACRGGAFNFAGMFMLNAGDIYREYYQCLMMKLCTFFILKCNLINL
jgi:hypothetical protein